MTKKSNKSFEKSIQRLDEIVQLLESDNIPLEEIITYYKEGVEISKYCKKILSDTEKNMKVITDKMNDNI
ncbi:MAG: exodeoxyribonuclease VII small subunit [Candidatus Marinimicrobia bacterium]|nr:exodeoxyribonuclease VII small subunit [Candidatus Neomarinimicrobiota bacterium]